MFRHKMPLLVACLLIGMLQVQFLYAQCTQVSSDGYNISVTLTPTNVVTSATSCPYGYNFDLEVDYDITFSGSNIPASMYTLQATITCEDGSFFINLPNGGGSGSVTSNSNMWRNEDDCLTANVDSVSCSAVDLELSGSGISEQTIDCTPATLPIELLHFQAKQLRDHVVLNWSTSTEINNDFFTIERAGTDHRYFPILTENGAGTSRHVLHYQRSDRSPLSGTNYYRLKQTDFDGQYAYSIPVRVDFQDSSTKITLWQTQSQPDLLHLRGGQLDDFQLEALSPTGVLLQELSASGQTLRIPDLPAGVYLLRLTHQRTGEQVVQRFVAGMD